MQSDYYISYISYYVSYIKLLVNCQCCRHQNVLVLPKLMNYWYINCKIHKNQHGWKKIVNGERSRNLQGLLRCWTYNDIVGSDDISKSTLYITFTVVLSLWKLQILKIFYFTKYLCGTGRVFLLKVVDFRNGMSYCRINICKFCISKRAERILFGLHKRRGCAHSFKILHNLSVYAFSYHYSSEGPCMHSVCMHNILQFSRAHRRPCLGSTGV